MHRLLGAIGRHDANSIDTPDPVRQQRVDAVARRAHETARRLETQVGLTQHRPPRRFDDVNR